jgi:hypothetical protein
MNRVLLTALALAVLALSALAEPTVTSPETVIQLTVQPAAAPEPALRYLLLPELKEMNPGNPCYNYLKCFGEQQKFFFDKEAVARREKLLAMPLKELPAQELQDYAGAALTQADYAARLDKPDWEILLKLKVEGLGLLLPDVQQMRVLASALKVRFRAEVALGRFDDALRTAKTMFALSRHLGEHLTYIGDLVGIAVANVAIGPLEEMLEQPGCPNLYWALTNLPSPLIPLDTGTQGERCWTLAEFGDLDESAPMSEDQLKKFITRFNNLLGDGDGKPVPPGRTLRAWLDTRTTDERLVNAARRRLVEVGLPEERLLRFPADQVILLDEKREYEVRRDELMKLMTLPSWQFEPLFSQVLPQIKPNKEQPAIFADLLLPAVEKVHRARARLDQRIALLRHVEALRLYAAKHDGKLPEKLAEISVPLPVDPFNGKPFRYEVSGNTAHLRGSPPPAEVKNPAFNVHYEVTLQK